VETDLRFDRDRLRADLAGLPAGMRAVFALLCARRLAPAYERAGSERRAFAELHARLRRHLTGDRATVSELTAATARVEAMLPDEEGAAPYAGDAVAALAYAFRAAARGDTADAAWAAERVYNALDAFAQEAEAYETGTAGGEEALRRHPLVQAELRRQDADVAALRALQRSEVESSTLDDLCGQADAAAASLFG
jgi:hypothetical protein